MTEMLAAIFTGSLWQLAAGLGVLLFCIICASWLVILCRPSRNQTQGTKLAERPIDDGLIGGGREGVIGGGG